jgi:xylose isomerase
MLVVLENDGLGSGGLNFDAKLRRESTDLEDLFIAHIGGMDAFARGLLIANQILNDPRYAQLKKARYTSFDEGLGADFEAGKLGLSELRDHAAATPEPALQSGKQELLENLVNDHMFHTSWRR